MFHRSWNKHSSRCPTTHEPRREHAIRQKIVYLRERTSERAVDRGCATVSAEFMGSAARHLTDRLKKLVCCCSPLTRSSATTAPPKTPERETIFQRHPGSHRERDDDDDDDECPGGVGNPRWLRGQMLQTCNQLIWVMMPSRKPSPSRRGLPCSGKTPYEHSNAAEFPLI